MSIEANKNIVRRWVEAAWNNGDFSSAAQLYAPGYVLHNPTGDITGSGALTEFISTFRAAMPDLHMEIDDILGEGDKVGWSFTVTGHHSGASLMGVPPSGKAMRTPGLLITRFVDGKWADDQCSWDLFGMLQQLGVIPALA